jgi:hypothetical protein
VGQGDSDKPRDYRYSTGIAPARRRVERFGHPL